MLAPDEQAITHLPAGEGETPWVLGVFVTLKAQSDDVSFYEGIIPPEGGPPPNIHYHKTKRTTSWRGPSHSSVGTKRSRLGPAHSRGYREALCTRSKT